LSSIITDIADVLGLTLQGIKNISDITMNNTFVYVGSSTSNLIREITKILLSYGKNLFMEGDELVIYAIDGRNSEYEVPSISKSSGMIGEIAESTNSDDPNDKTKDKTTNNKRITGKSLLNPKIRIGGLINVKEGTHKGTYLIERLKYVGDNFGKEFYVEFEAVE
jgi:hypothetical protein